MSGFGVIPGDQPGLQLIAAERLRQIKAEGYDAKHDDQYHNCSGLVAAAICYAIHAGASPEMRTMINLQTSMGVPPVGWPWDFQHWKPSMDNSVESRIRELTKAGALIAAAIDHLKRNPQ